MFSSNRKYSYRPTMDLKPILALVCLAAIVSAAPREPNPVLCEKCKEDAQLIKDNLSAFETVWILRCKMNQKDVDKCIAKVKEYVDYLSKHTPEQICEDKGYCAKTSSSGQIRLVAKESIGYWQPGKAPLEFCERCKKEIEERKKDPEYLQGVWIADFCKRSSNPKLSQEECIASNKESVEFMKTHTPDEVCQAKNECPWQADFRASVVCDGCKKLAEEVKAGAPGAESVLKNLCKSCGAPENVKKCERAIDDFIKHIDKKSPEELCTEIGICKKD